MKLIITESKMNSAVTKWLDKKYGNLTPIPHSIFTTFANDSGDTMFFYDNHHPCLVHQYHPDHHPVLLQK